MAPSRVGKRFLGKVFILERDEAMRSARMDKPETGPGRLVFWTDMSMFDGRVGLAAAYKLHTEKYWREFTRCLDVRIAEDRAELGAISLALEGARGLKRPEDREIVVRCDSWDALSMIQRWVLPEPGQDQDLADGVQFCERIFELAGQIQGGKEWKEADVRVSLYWVKGHAHKSSKGGDGLAPIVGNCWADWMAGYAISPRHARERSRHDIQALEIMRLVDEREAADRAARAADKAARDAWDDVDAILQAEEDAMRAEQGLSMTEGEGA